MRISPNPNDIACGWNTASIVSLRVMLLFSTGPEYKICKKCNKVTYDIMNNCICQIANYGVNYYKSTRYCI